MLAHVRLWSWRLALAAVTAAALAYVPYRVYGSEGYAHYRKLKGQLGELEGGNARRRAENARLTEEIHRLRDDLDAIGAVARDELGMVGPGEIVIKIEGDAARDGTP
jgi:cell division protein FtsB